jgi:hypothetical protein
LSRQSRGQRGERLRGIKENLLAEILITGLEQSHHAEERLQRRQTGITRGGGIAELLLQISEEVEEQGHGKLIQARIRTGGEAALPVAKELDKAVFVAEAGVRRDRAVLGQVGGEEIAQVSETLSELGIISHPVQAVKAASEPLARFRQQLLRQGQIGFGVPEVAVAHVSGQQGQFDVHIGGLAVPA